MNIQQLNMLIEQREEVSKRMVKFLSFDYSKETSIQIRNKCQKGICKVLGEGRTRATFELSSNKVAKLLKRQNVDMSLENFESLSRNEYKLYQKYGKILPLAKCYSYDEETGVLIMERTVSFERFINRFQELCPDTSIELGLDEIDWDFLDDIRQVTAHAGLSRLFGLSNDMLKLIREKTDLRFSEVLPIFNWGVNQRGQLVCIDYGEINDMYYSDSYMSCSISENTESYSPKTQSHRPYSDLHEMGNADEFYSSHISSTSSFYSYYSS